MAEAADPPPPPEIAADVFRAALPAAVRYVEMLAGAGVTRGLIGPREAPRLWTRHVLNSAVLSELLPESAELVDVGSGAGLPGIPVALACPTVSVTLVEPLARRCVFLQEVVDDLELADRVRVVRGRAEEPAVRRAVGTFPWVTARAVAPLDRLLTWCAPLLAPGATLLAIKGSSVWEELEQHQAALRSRRVAETSVVQIGARLPEPTWVAVIRMDEAQERRSGKRTQRGGGRRFT